MEHTHHPLLDSHPYRLSEDGRIKLQEIRDQLLFLATLAYPQTKQEEGVLLEVVREALGESFENFALQIDAVLHQAVVPLYLDEARKKAN